MKRFFILLSLLFFVIFANAQFPASTFPSAWEGTWVGTLDLLSQSGEPIQVYNELRIKSNCTQDTVEFTIIHGSDSSDVRSYVMIKQVPPATGWVLDELDGITIQSYFIGNRLVNLFEVQQTVLFVSYDMRDREMFVDMYSFDKSQPAVSGGSSEEVPAVTSYPLKAYTRSTLIRK